MLCNFCISSSSACDIAGCTMGVASGPVPVCNLFGCNCNKACGCKTGGPFSCKGVTCCGDDVAARAAAQTRFDEIDRDGDGKISPEEAWGWFGEVKGESWEASVDRTEFAGGAGDLEGEALRAAIFARQDTDGEGYIEPAELDASLAAPEGGGEK